MYCIICIIDVCVERRLSTTEWILFKVTFITLVTLGNMFLSFNCPLLFVLNLLSPLLCQSWPMCFIMQHLYGKRRWIFLFYIQHEGSKIYAKKVTDKMSREASTNVLQFIAPEINELVPGQDLMFLFTYGHLHVVGKFRAQQ